MNGQDPQEPIGQQFRQALSNTALMGRAGRDLLEFEKEMADGGGVFGDTFGGAENIMAAAGAGLGDSLLRLGRGVNWLGYAIPKLATLQLPESTIPEEYDLGIPKSVSEALPERASLRLESRLARAPNLGPVSTRAMGEIGGEVLGLVASGGTGLLGQVAGAPGKAISALSAPGVKLGAKVLESLPAASKWAQIAQKTLPPVIGTATGFSLYNYMTEEGSWGERLAAAGHGAVAGAAIGAAGQLGRAVERGLLNKLATTEQKAAVRALADGMSKGNVPLEAWKKVSARAVGAAVENTGFASLSDTFWQDAIHGVMGDKDAMLRALGTWFASYPAVLLAYGANHDTFRRDRPDLNNLETRLLTYRQEPSQSQDPRPIEKGPEFQEPLQKEPAAEAAGTLPALAQVTDPLFKSGWDLKPDLDISEGIHSITLEFPGSGSVRLSEDITKAGEASSGFYMEVPADVFRAVRGDVNVPGETKNIRMEGAVAQEFARDLAAISILMRIRGDLLFGHQGEVWAGGPWRGEDGLMHSIGLDGQHYTRSLPAGDAESWKLTETPPLPVVDQPAAEHPEIQRWAELAQALRSQVADNPGLDLLEGSIALAMRGSPESANVQQLVALLAEPWQQGIPNADLAAALLRPGNIEQFGLTVGQVAAGHLTAEAARQQIGTTMLGPSEGSELPAPEEEKTAPEERDWMSAEPSERREAAARYVSEAEEKPTAAYLRDTFGIPRRTARDILDRSGESGSVVDIGQAIAKGVAQAATATGRMVSSAYDFFVRDQIASIEARSGESQLPEAMRRIASRTRTHFGQAQSFLVKALPSIKAMHKKLVEDIDVRGVPTPRWIALAQGDLSPRSDRAIQVADAIADALLVMHDALRKAGGKVAIPDPKTGEWRYGTPSERVSPIVARVHTDEFREKVLQVPARRLRWWDELARRHSGVQAANLEKLYVEGAKATDVDSPEKVAAVEIARQLRYVPATWEEIEILEHDPMDALHDILTQQASRVAMIEELGQDLPASARDPGDTRPGVTKELERFGESMRERGVRDAEEVLDDARMLLQRLQGKEPERLRKGMAIWQSLMNPRRAAMAMWSGVWDVPSVFSEGAVFGGTRRLLRALYDATTGYSSAAEQAEAMGSLFHEIGNLDMGNARDPLARFSGLLTLVSNKLERTKTVVFDRLADWMQRGWDRGEVHAGDREGLTDLLGWKGPDADMLLSRKAPDELKARFRHEFVQWATSRGRSSERSRFAASPRWRAFIPFGSWASKRLFQLAKEVRSAKRIFARKSTLGERAAAIKRVVYRALGIEVGGLFGQLLYYMVTGIFRDESGFDRFFREMVEFKLETLFKAGVSGILAGPFAVLFQAAYGGEKSDLVRLVEPVGIVAGLIETAWRGGSITDIGRTVVDVAERTGFLPKAARELVTTIAMASLGQESHLQDAREVSRWRRLAGIKGSFQSEEKQAEFYDAMRDIRKTLDTLPEGQDPWPLIEPQVRAALGLQSEDTVAAKIRSFQHLDSLTKPQRDDFLRYLRDDKRYARMLEHDRVISDLAKDIGKMEGTDPTPFEQSIEMAGRQAALGAENAWSELAERVVEHTARRMMANEPDQGRIEALAAEMARHPASLMRDRTLNDNAKPTSDMSMPDTRSYIEAVLYQRADQAWRRMERAALKKKIEASGR